MILHSKNKLVYRSDYEGFTLIELLAVIAVISLLIAILLPVINKARTLSMRLVCTANLKQLCLAWTAYLDDHDGRFYQAKENASFLYGGWKGIYYTQQPRPLNKYLSLPELPESETEAKVFKCPADNGSVGFCAYSSIGTSYRTNSLLIGQMQFGLIPNDPNNVLQGQINNRLVNLKVSDVDNPSYLLLLGDFGWADQWRLKYPRGPAWHGRCCHFNLAFLDGHVEFLKITKGLYITDKYTVIPFRELYGLAREVQSPEPCPDCDPQ